MLDESAMPWPQKGDKLFMEGEDWYHNACLRFLPDSFHLYIVGYKEAGDRLVASVMEDRSHLDALVFPTVFLYRQYLELCLKYLIRQGNLLLDIKPRSKTGFPGVHEFEVLWPECKAVLSKVGKKHPELKPSHHDLETIGHLLTEFAGVDPGSDAFRYPVDKDNNLSIPLDRNNKSSIPETGIINLPHLAEIMGRMASFFDAAMSAISTYLELKRDIEQYNNPFGPSAEFG